MVLGISSVPPAELNKNFDLPGDKFPTFLTKKAYFQPQLTLRALNTIFPSGIKHISFLKANEKESLLSSNTYLCGCGCSALGHMTEQISHLIKVLIHSVII